MFSIVTFRLKCLTILVLLLLSLPGYTAGNKILVFGDSISAAYGMEPEQGWVQLLAQRLAQEHPQMAVVNASISGETTGGGLIRLPKSLSMHQPKVVVLELGGNDGLRGYPIDAIRDNLATMTRLCLDSGARVLLVGMVLPPNYGKRYTDKYEMIFQEVAESFGIPFLPFLLDGIATPQSLLQRDGIHPKPEAQPLMMEQIWPQIRTLLNLDEASVADANLDTSDLVPE
jgi:acyl-CoA thioesterase I